MRRPDAVERLRAEFANRCQVVRCLTGHLGNPVPSPALFSQIGNRFVRDVKAFARANRVPILRLNKPDRSRWDDRGVDHVHPYVAAAEAAGRFGVVAIVSTQEFQWVFSGRNRSTTPGVVSFDFTRSSHRVGTYLLLRARRRVRPGVHQDLHLLPVSGEGLGKRPRVGQAASRPGRDRLHGAGQRVRHLR